jgi:hypothetical protein
MAQRSDASIGAATCSLVAAAEMWCSVVPLADACGPLGSVDMDPPISMSRWREIPAGNRRRPPPWKVDLAQGASGVRLSGLHRFTASPASPARRTSEPAGNRRQAPRFLDRRASWRKAPSPRDCSCGSPAATSSAGRRCTRILPGEVWDCRRLADAPCAVTRAAAGNSLRAKARLGELPPLLDEIRIWNREHRERRFDVCVVGGYVGDIVRRERAPDRRHDGACAHARTEVVQLPREIGCRLTGEAGNAPLLSELPVKAWHCAQAGAAAGVPWATLAAHGSDRACVAPLSRAPVYPR